jgi:gluconolactonase
MTELREITSGLRFPEGPIAMPDGSVILVEMFGPRLTRVLPDGSKQTIATIPGGPNGAAIGPDGAVYLCNNGGVFTPMEFAGLVFPGPFEPESYIGGCIQRVDIDSGKVTTLYTECDGDPLRGPNDIVFDAFGGFYFTDHGIRTEHSADRTGIYYALPDGSSITRVIHPVDSPNGIGLSPDGTKLYYAETHTGRLFQRTVSGPGQIEPAMPLDLSIVLHGFPGIQMLDSLGVDNAGNICVAVLADQAGIAVIAPSGQEIARVLTGDLITTNVCFSADGATAFITASSTGRLLTTSWPPA